MYTFRSTGTSSWAAAGNATSAFHDINPEDLTLISRVHAILRFDGTRWMIVDKSQNGISPPAYVPT